MKFGEEIGKASDDQPDNESESVNPVLIACRDSAAPDEIEYAIFVRNKVREGRQAFASGKYFSAADARLQMREWLN
ncbi:hypothetical protein [Planctomicrobium piriforme]|uniref:Uncharacterized protein n=1 Tax=Planctomicrobium piriforme TaxID=1576369 RepID=A0A1I3AY67_9PLAN|nr:hypothetical protein [Planctomicrobium piriforme]SFH54993.1 hypothetical protein SAMN05421753_101121 [Planctomicrobium piriforme]